MARKKSRVRLLTRGEKAFDIVNVIVLFVVGLIMLLPFYVVLIHSVTPSYDFGTKTLILWPSWFDLTSYRSIIGASTGLVQAYSVTIFATLVGTLLNMIVTLLASVGLSNKKLPYRNGLTMFMVITMYFGPGMIPAYMMNKYLGLINNIWVYIWPGLLSVWNMFLMRNFIMGIPHEIVESASIDGCSELRMIWAIIMPLSTAAIATISLFYAVSHWNDLFSAVMYITDPRKYSLQAYLMTILQDARNMVFNEREMAKLAEARLRPPPSEALKAANIMAATIPIVCVYPFLQKYFVKGVVVGSLKG